MVMRLFLVYAVVELAVIVTLASTIGFARSSRRFQGAIDEDVYLVRGAEEGGAWPERSGQASPDQLISAR